jgi:hypothetical protein
LSDAGRGSLRGKIPGHREPQPASAAAKGGATSLGVNADADRATELLLSKSTKIDRPAALLHAANRNDVSLARALFDRGMPVDGRGVDDSTALMIAAARGWRTTVTK